MNEVLRAHLLIPFVVAFGLSGFLTPIASASPSPNGRPLALSAESVLLLDPEGKTLYAKNAEFEHAPASLVKLMTSC